MSLTWKKSGDAAINRASAPETNARREDVLISISVRPPAQTLPADMVSADKTLRRIKMTLLLTMMAGAIAGIALTNFMRIREERLARKKAERS
jgi:hypothetical protein